MSAIYHIVGNEINIIIRDYIIILFVILIFILAFLNAAGCSASINYGNEEDILFFSVGYSNLFWPLSLLFSFLSMCIGISSIIGEKQGSTSVLTVKPIYKRDIIIGKFLGCGIIIFLMITFTISLYSSLMLIVYQGPLLIEDLFLRTGSFIILLFFNCCFTLGLVMLFGITLGKTEALTLSISYVTFEYLTTVRLIPPYLNAIDFIDPMNLYVHAVYNELKTSLFDVSISSITWLNHSLLFIILMIAEVVVIILINCIIFIREES